MPLPSVPHDFEKISLHYESGRLKVVITGETKAPPNTISLQRLFGEDPQESIVFALLSEPSSCECASLFHLTYTLRAETSSLVIIGACRIAHVEFSAAQELVSLGHELALDQLSTSTLSAIPRGTDSHNAAHPNLDDCGCTDPMEQSTPSPIVETTVAGDDVDLYSWAWVVEKFTGGIVSGAGSLVFQEVVSWLAGRGQSVESHFVRVMDAFARRVIDAIDRATLDRVNGQVIGISRNFVAYVQNPTIPANREKLERGLYDLELLIGELQVMGNKGFAGFLTASALKVLMYQEFVKLEPSDLVNMAGAIDTYRDINAKKLSELWTWHEAQHGAVFRDIFNNKFCFIEYHTGPAICAIQLEDAEKLRQTRIKTGPRAKAFQQDVLVPGRTADYGWNQLRNYVQPNGAYGPLRYKGPGSYHDHYIHTRDITRYSCVSFDAAENNNYWELYIFHAQHPSWEPTALVTAIKWVGGGTRNGHYLAASTLGPDSRGLGVETQTIRPLSWSAGWVLEPDWNGGYVIRSINYPTLYMVLHDRWIVLRRREYAEPAHFALWGF